MSGDAQNKFPQKTVLGAECRAASWLLHHHTHSLPAVCVSLPMNVDVSARSV